MNEADEPRDGMAELGHLLAALRQRHQSQHVYPIGDTRRRVDLRYKPGQNLPFRNCEQGVSETEDVRRDGLAQLRHLFAAGRRAPMDDTLNFHLVEVERGKSIFDGSPDGRVYNPVGAVHGGYAATLLDSACGIATHTVLGPGRNHTTLELKVSFLRGISSESGKIRATGRVISCRRRVSFAEAELHDGAGALCATATSTLLVFDVEPGGQGALEPLEQGGVR